MAASFNRGFGGDVAASAAGIVGAGLAISRVGAGFILDRFFAPFIALLAFVLGAIGSMILIWVPNSPALLLTAALPLGVSTGSEGDLIPYLARPIHQASAFLCVACAAVILALGKYPATYPRQGGHAGLQGLTMTSTSFVGAVRPAGGRARRSVHSRQIHHAQA